MTTPRPAELARVYVLTEDFGEYSNWSMSVAGVYSTLERAQAAVSDAAWAHSTDGGVDVWHWSRHTQAHFSSGQCWNCEERWTIAAFPVDAEIPR